MGSGQTAAGAGRHVLCRGQEGGRLFEGHEAAAGIADVLMKDPKVIIMDEPTLGIDPEGMRELIALIRELSVEDGGRS